MPDICSMHILITAATAFEIQPLVEFIQLDQSRAHDFEVLITGIGGISTAYTLTRRIADKRPDFIYQAGIAGSFHLMFPIESVVAVKEEYMADLGAEEEEGFMDVFDLGLIKENEPPFSLRILKNPTLIEESQYNLPLVRSVSINEVTTRNERIELIRKKYNPDIESMEGAAFHFVCLQEQIPFLQVRSISNYIGERNKQTWKIQEAIRNLNDALIRIISNQ